MLSYAVYKVMHLLGVLMVFLSLGGVTLHVINGGTKKHPWRKPVAITHGVGLLLALVGGFGLMARLGIMHGSMPGWAIAKLGIWVILGGLTMAAFRMKSAAKFIWVLALFLGATAAYLAGSKPF